MLKIIAEQIVQPNTATQRHVSRSHNTRSPNVGRK